MNTDWLDTRYDEKLLENRFLKVHKSYLPFIGRGYDNSRILIVGESHFIEQGREGAKFDLAYFDAHWWDNSCRKLNEQYEDGWYDTRKVVENYISGERTKSHGIFTNLVKSYSKVMLEEEVGRINQAEGEKLCDLAFMNFFQMPSLYRGEKFWNSLKAAANTPEQAGAAWEKAAAVSTEVLDHVMDVIEPELVVFVSVSAYCAYQNCPGARHAKDSRVVRAAHPGCSWWNKPSSQLGNKSGREAFEEQLRQLRRAEKDGR